MGPIATEQSSGDNCSPPSVRKSSDTTSSSPDARNTDPDIIISSSPRCKRRNKDFKTIGRERSKMKTYERQSTIEIATHITGTDESNNYTNTKQNLSTKSPNKETENKKSSLIDANNGLFTEDLKPVDEPICIEQKVYKTGENNPKQLNNSNRTSDKNEKPQTLNFREKRVSIGDGSSFWTNSAENHVMSLNESVKRATKGQDIDSPDSPTESTARNFLINKRNSLVHIPTISRMTEREPSRHSFDGKIFQFQKVKKELRNMKESPEFDSNPSQQETNTSISNQHSTNKVTNVNKEDLQTTDHMFVSSSVNNIILNLVPAPIIPMEIRTNENNIYEVSNSKKKSLEEIKSGNEVMTTKNTFHNVETQHQELKSNEDKSVMINVYKQSSKPKQECKENNDASKLQNADNEMTNNNTIKLASYSDADKKNVSSGTNRMHLKLENLNDNGINKKRENNQLKKGKETKDDTNLKSPDIVQHLNGKMRNWRKGNISVNKSKTKSPALPITDKEASEENKCLTSISDMETNTSVNNCNEKVNIQQELSLSLVKEKKMNSKRSKSATSSKISSGQNNKVTDHLSSSNTYIKERKGENKYKSENVGKIKENSRTREVSGGFMAPTKSWLSYKGDTVSLKSRSPSPNQKLDAEKSMQRRPSFRRSASPVQRRKDSSSDSETQLKRSTLGIQNIQNKNMDKDPNLPKPQKCKSKSKISSNFHITSTSQKDSQSNDFVKLRPQSDKHKTESNLGTTNIKSITAKENQRKDTHKKDDATYNIAEINSIPFLRKGKIENNCDIQVDNENQNKVGSNLGESINCNDTTYKSGKDNHTMNRKKSLMTSEKYNTNNRTDGTIKASGIKSLTASSIKSQIETINLNPEQSNHNNQPVPKKLDTNRCKDGSPGSQLRTTMVVCLHPGQDRRNSQNMEEQKKETDDTSSSSICGLEITFTSLPQDIDIKLIPGNSIEKGEMLQRK